ncbi:hypothetical protein HDR60_05565, partial [bacterium]|nr:hypothetical protein [bacterium]
PANTNAQTFYQCMPITCSDGQYIKDGKCTSCPAGTFQKGNNRATSCTPCSAGTYSSAGASSCKTCGIGQYQDKTGQSSCKSCNNSIKITLSCDYKYCDFNVSSKVYVVDKIVDIFTGITPANSLSCADFSGPKFPNMLCPNDEKNGGIDRNNDLGYVRINSKKFSYENKQGNYVTVKCNGETGEISSVEVHD